MAKDQEIAENPFTPPPEKFNLSSLVRECGKDDISSFSPEQLNDKGNLSKFLGLPEETFFRKTPPYRTGPSFSFMSLSKMDESFNNRLSSSDDTQQKEKKKDELKKIEIFIQEIILTNNKKHNKIELIKKYATKNNIDVNYLTNEYTEYNFKLNREIEILKKEFIKNYPLNIEEQNLSCMDLFFNCFCCLDLKKNQKDDFIKKLNAFVSEKNELNSSFLLRIKFKESMMHSYRLINLTKI